MAKIDGDDVELTDKDASVVKSMLHRGDKQHHIAAYFGVDSRAISHINKKRTFAPVASAPSADLPPPGPYRADPTYIGFYRKMVQVNTLWNQRSMKEAKYLLEASLKSPALPEDRNSVEQILDDLFRDEFGVSTNPD